MRISWIYTIGDIYLYIIHYFSVYDIKFYILYSNPMIIYIYILCNIYIYTQYLQSTGYCIIHPVLGC